MDDETPRSPRAPGTLREKPPLGLTLAVGAGYALGKLLAVVGVLYVSLIWLLGLDLSLREFAGAVILTTYVTE